MAAVFLVTHSKHPALFAVITFSFIIAVTDGCTYDTDCPYITSQVCCNGECVYDSSCVGRYCTSDSNCSSDESCCSSECEYGDCLGSTCSNDTDCGVFERCCYETCQDTYEECHKPAGSAGVIAGAIIGSFCFSLCLIGGCKYYCRLSSSDSEQTHSNTRQVVQTTPPLTVTSTTYTRCVVQRSIQQAYPYQPPPRQTTNRPPKIDNTLAASRRPPPYNAIPQGRSGGLYAPQTSYGAVQSAEVV